MAVHVLRVEGVDMTPTILDVDDLATLRGGSLALLDAPKRAKTVLEALQGALLHAQPKVLIEGASQGAFEIDTDAPDAVLEQVRRALSGESVSGVEAAPIYRHLHVVADIAPVGGDGVLAALAQAQAANRLRQLQDLSLPVPDGGQGDSLPCPIDRVRPASSSVNAPTDRRKDWEIAAGKLAVSHSVAARRTYGGTRDGQGRRQKFYETDLGIPADDVPVITDSFEALAQCRPPGLPESLHNKIAIVYMDGNRFGKTVRAITQSAVAAQTDPGQALAAFSNDLREHRKQMLLGLIDFLRAITAGRGAAKDRDPLALETLLWGGDEAMWVLPGWLAWDFVGALLQKINGWKLEGMAEGSELSHSIGVVVCGYKTPIREMTELVHKLADEAKESMKKGEAHDACVIEILESLDVRADGLKAHRAALFGCRNPAAPVIAGKAWSQLTAHICGLKASFPRSQLYRLLRIASLEGVEAMKQELSDVLAGSDYRLGDHRLTLEDLLGEALPGHKISPTAPLVMLAQLWDYVDPLGIATARTKEAAHV